VGATLSRRIARIYGPHWGTHCACPVDCWIMMTSLPPPAGVHSEPSGGAAGVEPVRLAPPFACHAQFPELSHVALTLTSYFRVFPLLSVTLRPHR
jgi:hypothetical protein